MNLPPLPKQHKKQEADFGVQVFNWIKRYPMETCSLELKHTHGKEYLLYSEVKNEQIVYANAVNSDKGAWIRVQGLSGEPDYVYLRNEPAYVVVKYPKFFCFIPIGNLLFEKETHKRKSLTSERALEIASRIVKINC